MTACYWIKLYHEILDDPKMGILSDRIFRRVIEIFLIAGRQFKDGEIPDASQIAWMLRKSQSSIEADLKLIEKCGIIKRCENGGWIVVNFKERQDANTDGDRKRQQRERDRAKQYYGHEPVTKRDNKRDNNGHEPVTLRDTDQIRSDTDQIRSEAEGERDNNGHELHPAPAASLPERAEYNPISTAVAVSAFQALPDEAFAERVYTAVTGFPSMPPSIRGPATEIILSMRARSPDKAALAEYLKPYYERWRGTRGKSGKPYSPLSAGWLEWALAGEGAADKSTPEADIGELVRALMAPNPDVWNPPEEPETFIWEQPKRGT